MLADPARLERFHIAFNLGITVGELDLMPVSEFIGWREYLKKAGKYGSG